MLKKQLYTDNTYFIYFLFVGIRFYCLYFTSTAGNTVLFNGEFLWNAKMMRHSEDIQ